MCHEGVTVIMSDMKTVEKRQNIRWKRNFTVTNQKNGQKNGKISQNGQMRFFMASAVKKWQNVLKLAMKWPIWQHCTRPTVTYSAKAPCMYNFRTLQWPLLGKTAHGPHKDFTIIHYISLEEWNSHVPAWASISLYWDLEYTSTFQHSLAKRSKFKFFEVSSFHKEKYLNKWQK